MKNRLRSLVMAATLASVAALGGNVALADDTPTTQGGPAAEHRHGCREGRHGKHGKQFFERLAVKLGLSEQQKAQAKAILKGSREQAQPLMASLKQERQGLRTLIHSGSDEAAVRAQSAKVAAVQADLAVQRAATARKLMALLTPDQQAKLKDLKAKWQEHGEH